MAEDKITPLIAQMLEAAERHLTQPVSRVTVMPGNSVVHDDCCNTGGQLHIRLVSIVGVSGLSQRATQPCNPLYQIRMALGVTRCAHVVDDQGTPPSPEEMAADAFQTFQDRADLVEAIVCDIFPMVEERYDSGSLRIEDWLPTTVQGGCVGGEQMFTFKHVLCSDCSEEEPAP